MMPTFDRLFVAFLFILLFSCSKDSDPAPEPEPIPEPVLTISSEAYSPHVGSECWLYIVDQAGKILETKAYKGLETLEFTAETKDQQINLVQFCFYNNSATMTVFAAIDVNSTLEFNSEDYLLGSIPERTGFADITVNNIPQLTNNYLLMSSPEINDTARPVNGKVTYTFPIFGEKVPVLLSTFNSEGIPVYKWTVPLQADESTTEDFADFIPYPNTITVPTSGTTSFTISGHNNAWEYEGTAFASGMWYQGSGTPPLMGYLPGYKGYYTRIQNSAATELFNLDVSYEKKGTIPTPDEMILPTYDFTLTGTLISDAVYAIDHDYTYSLGLWRYPASEGVMEFGAMIYSAKGVHPKITNIPAEILAKEPSLNLGNLAFAGAEFTEHLDGKTYRQTIEEMFRYHFLLETFEKRQYFVYGR